MHDYRSTRLQRVVSDIRYFKKYHTGDALAGLATLGILVLAPIIMALGR